MAVCSYQGARFSSQCPRIRACDLVFVSIGFSRGFQRDVTLPDVILDVLGRAFARKLVTSTAGGFDDHFIPLFEHDPRKLRGRNRAKGLVKGGKSTFTFLLDQELRTGTASAPEQAPGLGFGSVQQRTDRNFG